VAGDVGGVRGVLVVLVVLVVFVVLVVTYIVLVVLLVLMELVVLVVDDVGGVGGVAGVDDYCIVKGACGELVYPHLHAHPPVTDWQQHWHVILKDHEPCNKIGQENSLASTQQYQSQKHQKMHPQL
jgi:hypothetical protein